MKIEVINTGTELLLGEVTNTHLPYLGKQLFPLGLRIARQLTVPDGSAIRDAILETFDRADILIITGGLGPTTDDITREITAELLGMRLLENALVREQIAARLSRRGIPLRERMNRQAFVPDGATVLKNENGTAPGLYFAATEAPASSTPHIFLLPGPPRELIPMFENFALPILRSLCGGLPTLECRVYRIVGMGESTVEELIGLRLSQISDLEVGYCARPNEVDLRLIGTHELLDGIEPDILQVLGDHITSKNGDALEFLVVNTLRERGESLTVAESCTGGLIAHRLTNVPGASQIFNKGFITYSNEAKVSLLGVSESLLGEYGAVSEPVAAAMAEGALKAADAHYALGITGIAGPSGGSLEKPVGTVFIALASRNAKTKTAQHHFPTDRETFKQLASQIAFDMVRRALFQLRVNT